MVERLQPLLPGVNQSPRFDTERSPEILCPIYGQILAREFSHGLTVRLTVWGINSRSNGLASKSHDESENLEIAKQFR